MTKLTERVAGIEIRCDAKARGLLQSLRVDPVYSKLIRALGDITGELSYRDVEDAVIRVGYKTRARSVPHIRDRGLLSR